MHEKETEEVGDKLDRSPEFRAGYRYAARQSVTWLHNLADEMNDPQAKVHYNNAAFWLGGDFARGTIRRARRKKHPA